MISTPILRNKYNLDEIMRIVRFERGSIFGGAVRYAASENCVAPFSDYDIFAIRESQIEELKVDIIGMGFVLTNTTQMSYLFQGSITSEYGGRQHVILNLIRKYWGTARDVIEHFDFSVARAVYMGDHILVDENFHEDENALRLRIKHLNCPVSTMMRCMKYSKKGYRFPLVEAIKIFQDWEQRPLEYRSRLVELAESEHLSEQEIEELEALLRID